MKNFIYLLTIFSVFFISCVKDEPIIEDNEEKPIAVVEESVGKLEVYKDSVVANFVEAGNLYHLYKSATSTTKSETYEEYGEDIWEEVETIKLTGKIDARDFSTIKWNFRNIKHIDLSDAEIVAYKGIYGTTDKETEYEENTIPEYSFFYGMNHSYRKFNEDMYVEGMHSLESIVLPKTVKRIGRYAFYRNVNLKEIDLSNIEVIGDYAFRHCNSIESIYLPNNDEFQLGIGSFTDMKSLKEVHVQSNFIVIHHYEIKHSYESAPDGSPKKVNCHFAFGHMLDKWNFDFLFETFRWPWFAELGLDYKRAGIYESYRLTFLAPLINIPVNKLAYHKQAGITLFIPKDLPENNYNYFKELWFENFDNVVEE